MDAKRLVQVVQDESLTQMRRLHWILRLRTEAEAESPLPARSNSLLENALEGVSSSERASNAEGGAG